MEYLLQNTTFIGGWNRIDLSCLVPFTVEHLFITPNSECLVFPFNDETKSSTCFAVSTSTIMESVDA